MDLTPLRVNGTKLVLGAAVCGLSLPVAPTCGAAAEDVARDVRKAIERAVVFLGEAQAPSGEFLVDQCQDAALTRCREDRLTVATATVLLGLSRVQDRAAKGLKRKASAFLKQEMDANGVFTFHTRSEPAHLVELGTVSDTCLGQLALERSGAVAEASAPEAVLTARTGEELFLPFAIPGEDVKRIRADTEAREAFVSGSHVIVYELLDVVDPLVNAQAAACLAREMPQPLCAYLVSVSQLPLAPGYSMFSESPAAYAAAIGRAYARGATCLELAATVLRQRLLDEQEEDGSWGTPLETAWAVMALMDFGESGTAVGRAMEFLLQAQRDDGAWSRAPWWTARPAQLWWGSDAVSTGVVLEALGQYVELVKRGAA